MRGLWSARSTRWTAALVVAFSLLWVSPSGATTLLAELDTSSPAATLQSFLAEPPKIEARYHAYREAPTNARQLAMA